MDRHPLHRWAIATGFALTLTSLAATAADARMSLSLGGEYSTGDYGTAQKTRIWKFPVSFKYESDQFSLGVTAPLVNVDGPGTVIPSGMGSGGGMRTTPFSPGDRSEFGIGDVLLTGSFRLSPESPRAPRVDLVGKLKLGTGDRDDHLGTGEDEIAIQVDLEKTTGGTTLFGSLGYRMPDDPPGVNFRNVLYGSVGVGFNISDQTTMGLALNYQDNMLPGTEEPSDLTFFIRNKLNNSQRMTVYVSRGLSDGSPDWAIGVLLKFYPSQHYFRRRCSRLISREINRDRSFRVADSRSSRSSTVMIPTSV